MDPTAPPSKVLFEDLITETDDKIHLKTLQIFFNTGMKMEQASGIVVLPENIQVHKSEAMQLRVLAGS